MANRHKSQASGRSGAQAPAYAGGSSGTVKAAKKTSDGFKRGGKIMGKKSKGRMDKFARGGRTGGSPFSVAKVRTNGDACG